MASRADKRLATREALLESARTLFRHNGYEEVTIRQIAKDAGTSTGSVFANFTGKADLFEQAMGSPAPDVGQFLNAIIELADTSDSPDEFANLKQFILKRGGKLLDHLKGHHS